MQPDITNLGAAGAVVVVVFLFLKFGSVALNQLLKAIDEMRKESAASRAVSNETLRFLQNLNGSLKRAVQEKQQDGKP